MERTIIFRTMLSCWMVLLCLSLLSAQRLTRYEYWFDDNNASRTARTFSATATESVIADSANITTLASGLHTFYARFGTASTWSTTSASLFYRFPNGSSGNISSYEYWFDNAINSRIQRSVSNVNSSGIMLDSVNTEGISVGLHTFNIRLGGASGWSSMTTHLFYKFDNNNSRVNQIEYWLGNDFTNRKTKNITSNTEGVVLDSIDLGDLLCRDRYILHSRYRTQVGWSSVSRDTFDKKTYSRTEAKSDFIFRISDNKDYTVYFTDSSKNLTNFRWNFGDNLTDSIQMNPSHRYSKAGLYNVCLAVKNTNLSSSCAIDTFCQEVLLRGLNSVSPNRIANKGHYFLTIKGFGLRNTAKIQLYRPNEAVIATDTLIFLNSNEIRAGFRFNSIGLGTWNLRLVQNTDTLLLPNSILVEADNNGELDVEIISPAALLINREFDYEVIVSNQSNKSVYIVPILIEINSNKKARILNTISYKLPLVQDSIINKFKDTTGFMLGINDKNPNDSVRFASFFIPYIEAFGVYRIKIKVSSSNLTPVKMSVSISAPLADTLLLKNAGISPEGVCSLPGLTKCQEAVQDAIMDGLGYAPVIGPLFGFISAACAAGDVLYGDNEIGDRLSLTSSGLGYAADAVDRIPNTAQFTSGMTKYRAFAAAKAFGGSLLRGASLGVSIGTNLSKLKKECSKDKDPKKKEKETPTRGSSDPNLKIGIKGINDLNAISGNGIMPYTIYFENADTATAPASEVTVLDQLDTSKFDLSTLQFTGFGFGDSTYLLPPQYGKLKSFVREVDLRPRKNIILRVTGDVDSLGKIKWYFGSFDPRMMDVTQNIDDGFLPPNRRKPEGEGYVSFMIKPKPNLPHLTTFKNKADIVFDYNDAIATPVWTNTVDRVAPISRVNSIQRVQVDTVFLLRWSGTDNHAGVMDYTIYASENGGAYEPFIQNYERDSAYFVGKIGNRYAFYAVSRDYVGNIESKTPTAEVSTGRVAVQEIEKEGSWLGQNKPNPFSQTTEISYYLAQNTEGVEISVFDLIGKKVYQTKQEKVEQGVHTVLLNLNLLANGVYLYQLKTNEGLMLTRRMVISK